MLTQCGDSCHPFTLSSCRTEVTSHFCDYLRFGHRASWSSLLSLCEWQHLHRVQLTPEPQVQATPSLASRSSSSSLQEFPLAILRGWDCYCTYPTPQFSLRDAVDGALCNQVPEAQELPGYCEVYQTPVQGELCIPSWTVASVWSSGSQPS